MDRLARDTREAIAEERRSWARVRTLCDRIALVAEPCWRFGDGEGGDIVRYLFSACAQEGLLGLPRRHGPQGPVEALAARDGWLCHYCRCRLGWGHESVTPPEVEHRVPRSRGGSDRLDNLVLSCGPCNSQKGTRTDVEYFGWLAFG